MTKRILPTGTCYRCGRTVAVKAKLIAATIERYGQDLGSGVATNCLRPHKCQHGNWCDECREKHSLR